MGNVATAALKLIGCVLVINYGLKWGFRAGSIAGSALTDAVGGRSLGTFCIDGPVFPFPRFVRAD